MGDAIQLIFKGIVIVNSSNTKPGLVPKGEPNVSKRLNTKEYGNLGTGILESCLQSFKSNGVRLAYCFILAQIGQFKQTIHTLYGTNRSG